MSNEIKFFIRVDINTRGFAYIKQKQAKTLTCELFFSKYF
jgi:hypothetical protein